MFNQSFMLDIMENYTEDDYANLCERANAYGMESLTEEEQYVVEHYCSCFSSFW